MSDRAQRLFALTHAIAIFDILVQRNLEEATAGFTISHLTESLYPFARLSRTVGNWQQLIAALPRLTGRIYRHFFAIRIISHLIARQTNSALNIIQTRIERIFKYHDIATLRMTGRNNRMLRNRLFNSVGEFLDQNKVTDQ